jgi:ABC-type proline/glycine betaine transport system ATPase subunit
VGFFDVSVGSLIHGNVIDVGGYHFSVLGRIDVLLGVNGCGKSSVLRTTHENFDRIPRIAAHSVLSILA